MTHLIDAHQHPVDQSYRHHLLQVLYGRVLVDLLHDELGNKFGNVPLKRMRGKKRVCMDIFEQLSLPAATQPLCQGCFIHGCVLICFTHFMPLRCMIHSTMVAFTQNRMKKSTVSARNLCRGEGMVYSRPTFGERKIQNVII